MKFTSSRKLTLTGFGHVISFRKGDTLFVPPALHQEALAQGLEPVAEQDEATPTAAPRLDDSGRIEAIKAAMHQIAQRNDAGDFDAAGTPKLRAIENLTGGAKPVDSKERQSLWAEVVASVGA